MADFYYTPGKEGADYSRKADDAQPTLNGTTTNFSNGASKPVVVTNFSAGFSGDRSSSQSYIFAGKINRKDQQTTNVDTVDDGYPQELKYGTEDTTQYILGADPKKIKVSYF